MAGKPVTAQRIGSDEQGEAVGQRPPERLIINEIMKLLFYGPDCPLGGSPVGELGDRIAGQLLEPCPDGVNLLGQRCCL